jgi:co-chaperonin GroES (HSP10)
MENINQELVKRIQALPVPKDLEHSDAGVIPLGKSVLAIRVKGGERKVGSLIMPDSVTTQEFVARIVAVGPEVSSYLKVGLLVIYNSMANMESTLKGVQYLCMHESSIYYIVADEQAQITVAPMSPEEKRRNDKIKTQDAVLKRVAAKEKNDEDLYTEKLKARKKTTFAVTKPSKKK